MMNSKLWQYLKEDEKSAGTRVTRRRQILERPVSNQWTRKSRSVWLTSITCVTLTWGAITEWFFGSDTIKRKKCFQTHLSKFLGACKLSAWADDSFSPSTSPSSSCSEERPEARKRGREWHTQQCLTGFPKPQCSECCDTHRILRPPC